MSKTKSIHQRRPLSPHLSIYKPQISSVLSILHRITGFALYCGAILFSWGLIVTIFSSYDLSFARWEIFHCFLGKTILFGWIFSLFYHLFNGVRHLVWDAGYGFKLKTVDLTGTIVVVLSVLCTILCSLVTMLQS